MPFIRGRYHINPVAGEALEAAREAEAALAALHEAEHGNDERGADDYSPETTNAREAGGPIHRVEIETAEVVPSHSGRAQRGFVARIHRAGYAEPREAAIGAAPGRFEPQHSSWFAETKGGGKRGSEAGASPKPETHAFSDHRDLVDFLRGEFEKDCGK